MFKIRRLANRVVLLPFLAAVVIAAAESPAAAGDKKSDAAARARQLIGVLESAAAPAQKAIACKQLAIYGDASAVGPLAKLLDDKELASWARIALEAIPDRAAAAALREAHGRLHGKLLVGVINSIGARRDTEAVAGLAESLRSDDSEALEAAAVALGHIGTPSALAALEQWWAAAPAVARAKAAEGVLLCADKLLAEGKLAAAANVYDRIRQAAVPRQRLLEATRGAILARQSAGVPLLVEQLQSTDKARFALGLGVARELPGKEATQALLAELQRAATERQPLLLLALVDRSEAPLPALLAAAQNGPKHVRMVALRALGRQGDVSCVGALLAAAVQSDAELAQTAAEALAALPGNQVDADIAARLRDAAGKPRLALIAAAGERRIAAAVPALLAAAEDADAPTRCCALTALGQTVALDNLPVLIAAALQPGNPQESEAARAALSAACLRMPDREACAEKLAAAIAAAATPAKCRLLEILGAMGGARAARGRCRRRPRPKRAASGRRLPPAGRVDDGGCVRRAAGAGQVDAVGEAEGPRPARLPAAGAAIEPSARAADGHVSRGVGLGQAGRREAVGGGRVAADFDARFACPGRGAFARPGGVRGRRRGDRGHRAEVGAGRSGRSRRRPGASLADDEEQGPGREGQGAARLGGEEVGGDRLNRRQSRRPRRSKPVAERSRKMAKRIGRALNRIALAAVAGLLTASVPGRAAGEGPGRVVLENRQLCIEIDPANGAIARIFDKEGRIDLVPAADLADNFHLLLRDADKKETTILGRKQRLSKVSRQGDALELSWNGPLTDAAGGKRQINVRMGIRLTGPSLEFRFFLDNQTADKVAQAWYPVVGGLLNFGRETDRGETFVMAPSSSAWIKKIALPLDGLDARYPGQMNMSYSSVYNAKAKRAMYFASHDAVARLKHYRYFEQDSPAGKDVFAAIEHVPFTPPGKSFEGSPVVLRFYDGGWEAAGTDLPRVVSADVRTDGSVAELDPPPLLLPGHQVHLSGRRAELHF